MRIASIDIGTNTVLLLIADLLPSGHITVVHEEQVFARLGKGVDENKIINQDTFERVGHFLAAYKTTCDSFSVDKIIAVGTSALRDAGNRDAFCEFIKHTTGIAIEVLSGAEEARWTYRGGISEFLDQSELFSVIDIGGGSTEIIAGTKKRIHTTISIDIGSVRLTERILKESPPEYSSIAEAYQYILSHIPETIPDALHGTFAIGVAGTATTLAALHQHLPVFDPAKISGYVLPYSEVCALFGLLKDKNIHQLQSMPQIHPGRADILLAGTMILMGVMEKCNIPSIQVSVRGLRYGILYRGTEDGYY